MATGNSQNEEPTLLRFYLREAWKLPTDEEWIRECQLSAQTGTGKDIIAVVPCR